MSSPFNLLTKPELVIGLVAPIGVDLKKVSDALGKALRQMEYSCHEIKLTALMREIKIGLPLTDRPLIQSYKDRIAYANELRRELGDNALAALSVTAIRQFRRTQNMKAEGTEPGSDKDLLAPLPAYAYVIRQLKRPEEVTLLRRVYGRQFFLLSAYASPNSRREQIITQQIHSTNRQISRVNAEGLASELLAQDSKEAADSHGQNVRDAFPMADVIVDATSNDLQKDITRFVELLFGHNGISPTHQEYGMYTAKAASLRSADLSRQVGAAIFSESGEIITMGSNEVPKSTGGTYWADDPHDARDHKNGHDPNDHRQIEILVDLVDRLLAAKALTSELSAIGDANEIASKMLSSDNSKSISGSMLMDILEFGRIVHAEMSALLDAARRGSSVKGATLYCTTFPCHMCAKHIVAAGISKVVYLEPYQKSYASELHTDSISVDKDDDQKVTFGTFIGISPFRYRDFFEKLKKRKDGNGNFQEWYEGVPLPNLQIFDPVYRDAETRVAAAFAEELERLQARRPPSEQLALPS